MTAIYQSGPTLPPRAATAVIVCIYVILACMAIRWAAFAIEKVVRLIRRTMAAEIRLRHLCCQYDRAALNYWIRDSFRQKRIAEAESRRADQEKYNKKQIAQGAEYLERRSLT